jgi:hypothetical protein
MRNAYGSDLSGSRLLPAPSVPVVEIADHAHALRVGRPDREGRPRDALHRYRMRAELFIRPQMRPLAEQVDVELLEHGPETVRVLDVARP